MKLQLLLYWCKLLKVTRLQEVKEEIILLLVPALLKGKGDEIVILPELCIFYTWLRSNRIVKRMEELYLQKQVEGVLAEALTGITPEQIVQLTLLLTRPLSPDSNSEDSEDGDGGADGGADGDATDTPSEKPSSDICVHAKRAATTSASADSDTTNTSKKTRLG
jgi:hypothetical protein